jgi:hypothetical protein
MAAASMAAEVAAANPSQTVRTHNPQQETPAISLGDQPAFSFAPLPNPQKK